jgi:hypothetical protein
MADKTLIISYVPMLYGLPREIYPAKDAETIKNYLEKVDKLDYPAIGAVWCLDEGTGPTAFLIVKEANKVYEHLLAWCEHAPTNWFDLYLIEKDEKYALALMPRFEMTVKRFKAANPAAEIDLSDVMIITKPLTFVGHSQNFAYLTVKQQLENHLSLGVIDANELEKLMQDEGDSPQQESISKLFSQTTIAFDVKKEVPCGMEGYFSKFWA